jgi:hypothetical protein
MICAQLKRLTMQPCCCNGCVLCKLLHCKSVSQLAAGLLHVKSGCASAQPTVTTQAAHVLVRCCLQVADVCSNAYLLAPYMQCAADQLLVADDMPSSSKLQPL